MSGKGDRRRPVLNQELADIGEAIWREKDPDKKDELLRQWEELKEQQWQEFKKNNPHLWGDE